ncbi:MAG: alginate lyase family protein [Bdellovibrionales bacterium]|nr:alginate lyase family protein [Bdellovibrionales bacterium]
MIKLILLFFLLGSASGKVPNTPLKTYDLKERRNTLLSWGKLGRQSCPTLTSPTPPQVQHPPLTAKDYGDLERYLTRGTMACMSPQGLNQCLKLKEWLENQMIPQLFLPDPKSWGKHGWYLSEERRLPISIHVSKLLSLMAIALWTIEPLSPLTSDKKISFKKWFLHRLKIYEPPLSGSDYEFKDDQQSIKISKKAHNIWISHSKALASVSLAFQDHSLISSWKSQWNSTLGHTRADGSLPIESRRGARALWYSQQALSDLTLIYWIAKQFQLDLFQLFPQTKKAYFQAVDFVLSTLIDQNKIKSYASANFEPGPDSDPSLQDFSSLQGRITWLLAFSHLWPKNPLNRKITQLKLDRSSCKVDHKASGLPCREKVISAKIIFQKMESYIFPLHPGCFLLTKKQAQWLYALP